MLTHLIQAIFFSLWAMLMLRLFSRAKRLHDTAARRKPRPVPTPRHPEVPMAVKVLTT